MADSRSGRFAVRVGAQRRQAFSERRHGRGLGEAFGHKLARAAGRGLETFTGTWSAGEPDPTAVAGAGRATSAGPIPTGRGAPRRHPLARPRWLFGHRNNVVRFAGPARADGG